MLTNLKYFGKCCKQAKLMQRYCPKPQYFGTTIWLRNNDPPLPPMTVTDINADDMMDDDDDFATNFEYRHRNTGSTGGDGIIKPPSGSSDGGSSIGSEGNPPPAAAGPITTTNLFGAPVAPIDINGWDDEEDIKECTVDYETIQKFNNPIEYPPVPDQRAGVYEFRGIKIQLPSKLATKGTYRYRLSEEDQATLADDTRICRFEPKPATAAQQIPLDNDVITPHPV